jgi:hypothetical protein
MGVPVSIIPDARQVKELMDLADRFPNKVRVAFKRSLNRTGNAVRVRVVRGVAGEINVKKSDLFSPSKGRRPIRQPKRASFEDPTEQVSVSGDRLPLGRFGVKQHYRKGVTGGRVPSRVSYRIDRAGARKSIRDAFIPRLKSGYVGVFRRRGDNDRRLIQLFGPSIPHVALREPSIIKLTDTGAGELLEKNLGQQIDLILVNSRRTSRG